MDRRVTETVVVGQIRLSKATWKKEHIQQIAVLENRIEVRYDIDSCITQTCRLLCQLVLLVSLANFLFIG
jgi:hypothetical protein